VFNGRVQLFVDSWQTNTRREHCWQRWIEVGIPCEWLIKTQSCNS